MARTKTDKIFDNKFNESNPEKDSTMKFKSTARSSDMDLEDELHFNMLYEQIDTLILNSKFAKFNEVDENLKARKLNKNQINELYTHIIKNLNTEFKRSEIFSIVSDYFDIPPSKFYNSLSNKFKNDLMMELDSHSNVLEKKGITKLF